MVFYYSRFRSGGIVIFGGVFLNDVYSCVSLLVLYGYMILYIFICRCVSYVCILSGLICTVRDVGFFYSFCNLLVFVVFSRCVPEYV